MRLFLAAIVVVATFVIAVLLISRLFPYGAGWAGVSVAITFLYASALGAWALLGKQTGGSVLSVDHEIARPHRLRDNLLYFSIAMVVVTIMIAVMIHDDERGIVRNFKNDWSVGLGSECIALGYAVKAFWAFRRNWRLWAIMWHYLCSSRQ